MTHAGTLVLDLVHIQLTRVRCVEIVQMWGSGDTCDVSTSTCRLSIHPKDPFAVFATGVSFCTFLCSHCVWLSNVRMCAPVAITQPTFLMQVKNSSSSKFAALAIQTESCALKSNFIYESARCVCFLLHSLWENRLLSIYMYDERCVDVYCLDL